MSTDFDLKELRKILIRGEQQNQPLGIDELLLLLAEYIDDEDVTTIVEKYVDRFDKDFESIRNKIGQLDKIRGILND